MVILLIFAFISGLVTILAPCIWPLLPIILSTSLQGGKAKSLGITLGIMFSFGVYTLTVSYLVTYLNFNPDILRVFAIILLIVLGLTMILPPLARVFEGLVSRLAGKVGQSSVGRAGFWGGLLTGFSLGIVWTPCAGPILTAIATLSATANVNFGIVLVTIAYLIGVGIPLFFFSYGGQKIVKNTRFLSRYTGIIQKIFGVVLILTALAIATNYDKVLQARLLDMFPSYSSFLTSFESNDTVEKELDRLRGEIDENALNVTEGKTSDPVLNVTNNPQAPNFTGITTWLNSEPLTMEQLKGKVVLIDFWTYTCINCIRTLPYVTSWYEKYKDDGLVVIGVHTPEFEFEKNTANVEDAIKRFEITYPVAQDNDFATWRAYNNRYWPAKYLIDKDGVVRRFHFGEGEYEETEKAIQLLLKEAGSDVSAETVNLEDTTPQTRLTPETYLGSSRMEYYFPSGNLSDGTKSFDLPEDTPLNTFTLGGVWTIADEYSMSGKNAALSNNFFADRVFLVMRPNVVKNARVRVWIDGNLASKENAGVDVDPKTGIVTLDTDRLYELVNFGGTVGNHVIRLEFLSPGIEVFAFTYG